MGSSKAPAPDPNIGIAQQKQMELAERQQKYFEENFAPRYMQQMDDQLALGRDQVGMQREMQDFQLGESRKYSDRYWGTQVGLEDELISKARGYNEASEQERMAGRAGADVSQSFAQSNQNMQRGLARRGVNAGSAAAISAMKGSANEEALAKAGAMNQTREAARQMGWTRLGEAAALGKGLPGFGNASSQLSMGAGMNSLTAGSAGMSAIGTTAGAFGANTSTTGNLYNSAGNLGVQSDRNRFSYQGSNGWAQAAAGVGGLMQGYGAMMGSSKKIKENKGGKVSGKDVLSKMRNLDNEGWKYKDGVEDSGQHVGPYAEDVRREFGDDVAPGGKGINMDKMGTLNNKAFVTLSQQVEKLERELASLR